jgi:signal transduction histidine kinase
VPEKVRAHLFEAFRGSGRAGGTGLGLAISAELTRAHGGELKLVERDGEGASSGWSFPIG